MKKFSLATFANLLTANLFLIGHAANTAMHTLGSFGLSLLRAQLIQL